MVCMLAAVCAACQVSKEKNVFELIRVSPAAKILWPDGSEVLVDSEIAVLRSFADLQLQLSVMEPADDEDDWVYRIIFNPAEKVKGTEEIEVSFHEDYVQINAEYYLPADGVSCQSILEWAQDKADYFKK